MKWPDLTDYGFVAHRAATEEDIGSGAAVFMLQSEGVNIGAPIDIEIPQYAMHSNAETGEQTLGVIIQAEEAQGQKVIGFMPFESDTPMAALLHEFELLGTQKQDGTGN